MGIAGHLENAFQGWRFPYAKLTAHELFNLIQLPVRRHYTRQVLKYFEPHLRMLRRALELGGCALGNLNAGVMSHIISFLMEEWGYQ